MKKYIAGAIALISTLVVSGYSKAENPAHVQQLLETNLCMGCDLVGANLEGASSHWCRLEKCRLA